MLYITTKGRPRHVYQILLVNLLPWELSEKGNTSVSVADDSKPAETTKMIANVSLAVLLNALCPSQKLPLFLTLIWRGSSYLLPGMAPCHHAKMTHNPSHPHQRSLSPSLPSPCFKPLLHKTSYLKYFREMVSRAVINVGKRLCFPSDLFSETAPKLCLNFSTQTDIHKRSYSPNCQMALL